LTQCGQFSARIRRQQIEQNLTRQRNHHGSPQNIKSFIFANSQDR
jgi:hypothetical protein